MHTFLGNVPFLVKCLVFVCCFDLKCSGGQMSPENPRKCSSEINARFSHDKPKISELEHAVNQFLVKKSWKVAISRGLELHFKNVNNSLSINVQTKEDGEMERKMQMSMKNMMPYMIVPGLFMAGILPWVIPGLKMAVMAVSMMNQMAFNAAFFSLIRSYIFDTRNEEHVVYINHGYRPKRNGPHGRR
ncbi:hypothetical protein Zmor_028261 [Zophobas morio]|uniref:Uncharacterized protein n=1 Tax=Zophobas morio TaxID=2755281 RepID=A0AA38M2W0_9CUCU|nr:hypothetical protein Zmor_028261 [Zophobas morio]